MKGLNGGKEILDIKKFIKAKTEGPSLATIFSILDPRECSFMHECYNCMPNIFMEI